MRSPYYEIDKICDKSHNIMQNMNTSSNGIDVVFKKTQKTPRSEIERALRYMNDYLMREEK